MTTGEEAIPASFAESADQFAPQAAIPEQVAIQIEAGQVVGGKEGEYGARPRWPASGRHWRFARVGEWCVPSPRTAAPTAACQSGCVEAQHVQPILGWRLAEAVTNTRRPTTIGLDGPRPGSSTFQAIIFS